MSVGVKVTLMTQAAPGASVAAHVLLAAKSPLAVMLAIASGVDVGFVNVTSCAALAVAMI